MLSVAWYWADMMELLASNGANISARDNNGQNALDIALEKKNLQLYKAVQDIMARGQQPSKYQEIHVAEQKKVMRNKEYSTFMDSVNKAMETSLNNMNRANKLMEDKTIGKKDSIKEYKKIIKDNEKAINELEKIKSATSLSSYTTSEQAEFEKMRQFAKEFLQIHNSILQYKTLDVEELSEEDREKAAVQSNLLYAKSEEMKMQGEVLKRIVLES